MLQTIRNLLSLIRFSHTLFALPFALLAAMMAWKLRALRFAYLDSNVREAMANYQGLSEISPSTENLPAFQMRWQELLGILLCMITARSAAMAFNRLVDRRLDAENPRTSGRHLPAGILSVPQVATFTAACGLAFIASTLLFLPNPLPLYLSVPVLVFICGYSLAKRFTSLAHVWLGTALALSPIAVWIAIRGSIVLGNPADLLPALVLGGAVLTWVTGFDIIYACQDFEFDRSQGLRSIPARLGIDRSLKLAATCHGGTVLLLALLPIVYPHFGVLYWIALSAVAGLLVYEHALVRPDDLDRVNVAFFQVNAVISLGLFAVSTLDLWLGSR
ncbi:UbiA-like polyprenyltransferase [Bythopirellula goksoeyrii]|nr:UbiA-like polyprenyltransferase [Bythopirellula goksoeyrii]